MAYMLKSDSLGFYNVTYDDETGEIIFDPRAIIAQPVIEPEFIAHEDTIDEVPPERVVRRRRKKE